MRTEGHGEANSLFEIFRTRLKTELLEKLLKKRVPHVVNS
jgi:hypothetical protein